MDITNTLEYFFVGRRKEKLFCRDPKIIGCGKKRVAEQFGLRNAGLNRLI